MNLGHVITAGGDRYYHASPRVFRRGDILTGGHPGGFGYAHPNVCLTTSVKPHGTIFEKAVEENWYIYEVEPLYRVHYVSGNQELQTKAAKVLRQVGRAGRFRSLEKGWSLVQGPPKGSKGSKGRSREMMKWRMREPDRKPWSPDYVQEWGERYPKISPKVLMKLVGIFREEGVLSEDLSKALEGYAYQRGLKGIEKLEDWILGLGGKLQVDVRGAMRRGLKVWAEGKPDELAKPVKPRRFTSGHSHLGEDLCKIWGGIVKAGTMNTSTLKFLQKMSKGMKGLVSIPMLREVFTLMGWGIEDLDVTILTNGKEWAEHWLESWLKSFRATIGGSLTKKEAFRVYFKDGTEEWIWRAMEGLRGHVKVVGGEPSGGRPGEVFITKPEIVLQTGMLRSYLQIDKIWIVVPGWKMTATNGKSEIFAHPMSHSGRLEDPSGMKMDSFWSWGYKNGLKESALSTLGAMDSEVVEEALAPRGQKPSVKRSFSREVERVLTEVVEEKYRKVVLALTKNALDALEAFFAEQEQARVKAYFSPRDFLKTKLGKKWVFFHEAIVRMVEMGRDGVYTRVSSYHEKAKKWAEEVADIAKRGFVGKNTVKLSAIVNGKGNLREAKILSISGGIWDYGGEIRFSFEDGSSFIVRNKTVWNVSALGHPFFQYPTTFHEVTLPDGSRMSEVSEKAMVERFSKI